MKALRQKIDAALAVLDTIMGAEEADVQSLENLRAMLDAIDRELMRLRRRTQDPEAS